MSNSGFGRDPETKAPTAPPATWDAYLNSHPQAAPFRDSAWPFYDKMHAIISGRVVTGNQAKGLEELYEPTTDGEDGVEEEEEEEEEEEDHDGDVQQPAPKAPRLAPAVTPAPAVTQKDPKDKKPAAVREKPAKAMSNVEVLAKSVADSKYVPVSERAIKLLWEEAAPTDAKALQGVLATNKALSMQFVALPKVQRAQFIIDNKPKVEDAPPTLTLALRLLDELELMDEEMIKAIEVLSSCEKTMKVFCALPATRRKLYILSK
jgi:hypothetical protein